MAATRLVIKKMPAEAELRQGLLLLADLEVLVGVPDENADVGREVGEPNNATLALIHDQGAPEANIPARPFMRPGIEAQRAKIEEKLSQTLKAVIVKGGGTQACEIGLAQTGIIAAVSIQNTINDGIPPPLSDYTLQQRMRKNRKGGGGARKGAAMELDRRWDGQIPSTEFAKPLVDTGAMRNSITYAIRSRKKRKT